MTAHNRRRRHSFAKRMHQVAENDRNGGWPSHFPDQHRHAATPMYPDGSIAIGIENTCLRCESAIVLTLTGWEHET